MSFDIKSNSGINPVDISYKEYKELSLDDLKTMYPPNSPDDTKTLFSQANKLWKIAITAGDQTLMETAYDMTVESLKNDQNSTTGKGMNALFHLSTMVDFNVKTINGERYIDIDEKRLAFALTNKLDDSIKKNLYSHNSSNKQINQLLELAKEHKPNSKPFEFTYENYLNLEEKFLENYPYFTDEYKDDLKKNNVFEDINELKTRYEEKIKENKKVLNEYLRR